MCVCSGVGLGSAGLYSEVFLRGGKKSECQETEKQEADKESMGISDHFTGQESCHHRKGWWQAIVHVSCFTVCT